jgi:hypothetical protein
LQSDILDLKSISVIENIFTYQGKRGHEIDYLFSGRLSKSESTTQNHIPLNEPYGEFFAEWVPAVEIAKNKTPLYPPYDYKQLLS